MMMEILLVGKRLQGNTILTQLLKKSGAQRLLTATTVEEAFKLVEQHYPQLIIIDCEEGDTINKAEITRRLNNKDIFILFLSSMNEYVEQSSGINYMIKPFSAKELPHTLHYTLQQLLYPFGQFEEATIAEDVIFVRQNQVLEKVYLSDIQWIESDGNYAIIHTRTKKFVLRLSLSRLKERLPEDRFQQINKSNIVQVALINNIDLNTNEIQLNGNQLKLPLGRTYKKELFQRLRQL